ncbi:MAG: HAD-IIIA family hydrolase, partial [Gammaproteobacteria bacterium]|nr:HAD-IIIA family hydrolase [Gammaproteobacteria bacterium]
LQLATQGGTIEAIFFCPHTPKDNCECRKPKPGLLLDIASSLRIPLTGVPVIGDSKRDLKAAEAAGAHPILVRTGKGTQMLLAHPELAEYPVYDNLAKAVSALLYV